MYICTKTDQDTSYMPRRKEQPIPPASPEMIVKYSKQFSSFASDYIFSRVSKTERFSDLTSHTMRMQGVTMVMCLNGSIDIDVNLESYHIGTNTLITISADSVFNIRHVDWDNLDAYVFIISPEFMRDINFDLSLMATISITSNQPPMMTLDNEEVALMSRYFDLIHYNTVDNTDAHYVRSIARSLIAASIYQLMQFASKRAERRTTPAMSRRVNYIKEFMHLLKTHHRKERSVAFYANELFITPKYLSSILRRSTGRSAAQWIDDYVILEAKNLLRFSGKNVQQIAYELNFSNQSSFGKYFKHMTGMSPTQFQKS